MMGLSSGDQSCARSLSAVPTWVDFRGDYSNAVDKSSSYLSSDFFANCSHAVGVGIKGH
jgi:hypothetical protein